MRELRRVLDSNSRPLVFWLAVKIRTSRFLELRRINRSYLFPRWKSWLVAGWCLTLQGVSKAAGSSKQIQQPLSLSSVSLFTVLWFISLMWNACTLIDRKIFPNYVYAIVSSAETVMLYHLWLKEWWCCILLWDADIFLFLFLLTLNPFLLGFQSSLLK